MKAYFDNCKCLERLILIGKVRPFTHNYDLSNYAEEVEVGTLCWVNQKIEDNGDYENYTWVSNIEINDELYPINYCPICGKEIKYKVLSDEFVHRLTKKN